MRRVGRLDSPGRLKVEHDGQLEGRAEGLYRPRDRQQEHQGRLNGHRNDERQATSIRFGSGQQHVVPLRGVDTSEAVWFRRSVATSCGNFRFSISVQATQENKPRGYVARRKFPSESRNERHTVDRRAAGFHHHLLALHADAFDGPEGSHPAEPGRKVTPPIDDIVISVLGDETVRLNEETVAVADLEERLRVVFKNAADHVIFIRGDKDLKFSYVAEVIDIARGAGLDRVVLMTQ